MGSHRIWLKAVQNIIFRRAVHCFQTPHVRNTVSPLLPSTWVRNRSNASRDRTHFGFQDVATDEKQDLVSNVFGSVASSYDLMNDAMSLGIHRLWKDALVSALRPTPQMRILDCAGGTGDIAFRIVETRRGQEGNDCPVTVCDINKEMLAVGRRKAQERGLLHSEVEFVEGNAECLPIDDQSMDAYVISFGMRNIPRPEKALREAFRVLKPGGRFMMLEFGRVPSPVISALYDAYSFRLIPAIGSLLAGDRKSYQYLVESIRRFPGQFEFQEIMKSAGFLCVTCTNYSFGVAAQYSAFKPLRHQ